MRKDGYWRGWRARGTGRCRWWIRRRRCSPWSSDSEPPRHLRSSSVAAASSSSCRGRFLRQPLKPLRLRSRPFASFSSPSCTGPSWRPLLPRRLRSSLRRRRRRRRRRGTNTRTPPGSRSREADESRVVRKGPPCAGLRPAKGFAWSRTVFGPAISLLYVPQYRLSFIVSLNRKRWSK